MRTDARLAIAFFVSVTAGCGSPASSGGSESGTPGAAGTSNPTPGSSGVTTGATTGTASAGAAGTAGVSTGTSGGGTTGATGATTGAAGATTGATGGGMTGATGATTGATGATTGAAGGGTTGAAGATTGASTGASGSSGTKPPGTSQASDVIVNPGTLHQRISGFGASSAWAGGYKNAADPTTLFSTTSGVGLSLLRVRIQPAPAGTTSAGEIAMAKTAQSMGVTIWATPWTPPATDKTNDSTILGSLSTTAATSWAGNLASYVATMKAAGVNLYAVSSQNEPDAMGVDYESCIYTAASLATFVGTNLGPAMASTGVKLMTPETQNWEGFATFEPALAANSAAWGAANIVATHEYGGTPKAYPAIQAAGKEFWETEWYPMGAEDATMTNGLVIADEIYQALTVANMNAWHYWWLYPGNTGDNQGLWDDGINDWAKRLWVMGNFSRWVRPGSNRIDVSGPVPSGVEVIAFQNPTDLTTTIVAINKNAASTTLPLFVSGGSWPASVVPWITSANDNLAAAAAITLTGARFSATLAAQSVTTFAGTP